MNRIWQNDKGQIIEHIRYFLAFECSSGSFVDFSKG